MELHLEFDKYDYWDVLKRINKIRTKHGESIEEFSNRFIPLCYEFLEEDIDWDFFKSTALKYFAKMLI